MFESVNQKAYLKQAKFAPGKDDELIATLTFYLTPISYPLAVEIDPHIADRLFRKVGPDQNPCQEFNSAVFQITPPSCQMKYILHEDLPDSGAMIPFVEFSKLRAFKPFSNDPNFALAFNVTFPVPDRETMWQLSHREKKVLLLTFDEAQPALPFTDTKVAPKCEECNEPPRYKTEDGQRFFCADHPRAAGEGVELVELSMGERTAIAKEAADASLDQPEEEADDSGAAINNQAVARRRARKKKKK